MSEEVAVVLIIGGTHSNELLVSDTSAMLIVDGVANRCVACVSLPLLGDPMSGNTKEPSAAARRFTALLSSKGLSLTDVLSFVQDRIQSKTRKDPARAVENFLSGGTASASSEVVTALVKFGVEKMGIQLEKNYFAKGSVSHLESVELYLAKTRQHRGILSENCGHFVVWALQGDDLKAASRPPEAQFRKTDLEIFPDRGGATFGFRMAGGKTSGFAVAEADIIHLVGFNAHDNVTYVCLQSRPERMGLRGAALFGFQSSVLPITERVPRMQGMARRVAVLRSRDAELHTSVADWLWTPSGTNAGFLVDLTVEARTDACDLF